MMAFASCLFTASMLAIMAFLLRSSFASLVLAAAGAVTESLEAVVVLPWFLHDDAKSVTSIRLASRCFFMTYDFSDERMTLKIIGSSTECKRSGLLSAPYYLALTHSQSYVL